MNDELRAAMTPENAYWHDVGLVTGWSLAWRQVEAACIVNGNVEGADFARDVRELGVAQIEAADAAREGRRQ